MRQDRLRLLSLLHKHRLNEASKQLTQATTQTQTEKRKYQDLQHFEQDYWDRLRHLEDTAVAATYRQYFQLFLNHLDQLKDKQEEIIMTLEHNLAGVRQSWQQVYLQDKAFRGFVERIQEEQQAQQAQADQKRQDEMINDRQAGKPQSPLDG